jgi:hypothetical protein
MKFLDMLKNVLPDVTFRIEDHLPLVEVPNPFEVVEPPPKRRPRGLFQDLLQGRPEALLHDSQEHPDSYSQDELELLQALYEGRRQLAQLTQGEMETLDKAVMEFASSTPKEKPKPVVVRLQRSPAAPVEETQDSPEVNAFWWS